MDLFQITIYPADITADGAYQVRVTRASHSYRMNVDSVSEVEALAHEERDRLNARGGEPCVVAVSLVSGRAPRGWRTHHLAKRFIECRRSIPV